MDIDGKWGNRCSINGMYMRFASAATSDGLTLVGGIFDYRAGQRDQIKETSGESTREKTVKSLTPSYSSGSSEAAGPERKHTSSKEALLQNVDWGGA